MNFVKSDFNSVKGGDLGPFYIMKSLYFVSNMAAIFVYPVSRIYFGMKQKAYSFNEDFLLGQNREVQIIALLTMIIVLKYIRSITWEEFISSFFLFSKLGFFILFLMNDRRWSLFYFALCLVIWMTMHQPKYRGPSKLKKTTSVEQFYSELLGYEYEELIIGFDADDLRKKKEKSNKKLKGAYKVHEKSFSEMKSTLLIFTAHWCENSQNTYSIWIKFANRFSTEKVQIIEIDTQKFDELARTFSVNCRDGNQMPTLILLQDNVEYLRFPPMDYEKGTIGKVISYKDKELIKYFDLEKRFLATKHILKQTPIKKKAQQEISQEEIEKPLEKEEQVFSEILDQ